MLTADSLSRRFLPLTVFFLDFLLRTVFFLDFLPLDAPGLSFHRFLTADCLFSHFLTTRTEKYVRGKNLRLDS